MERTGSAHLVSAVAIFATLWLAGCAAHNTANLSGLPPAPRAAQSAPASGHVTLASWYGPGFIGQRTASGEVYRRNDLTAASRNLPLGSRVRVTNLESGRSVVVRINDRGPYVRGRGIDLSERAAQRIGLKQRGVARVSVHRVGAEAVPPAASDQAARSESAAPRRHPSTHRYARRTYRRRTRRIVANPFGRAVTALLR